MKSASMEVRELGLPTMQRVSRRLIPYLFVLYVAAYLDRINIGFAQLQMKSALGFSDTVYGLGAGIFFIGYFLFEVPSNLMLARAGARVWIARIMITWGVISSAMAFVRTPEEFYALRFVLGVTTLWFLNDRPAQAKWLAPVDRECLERTMRAETAAIAGRGHVSLRLALLHPIVWRLSVLSFTLQVGLYSISFWLPQLVKL